MEPTKNPKNQRRLSSATLALVEDPKFGIKLIINLDQQTDTDPALFDKIKAGIAGLSYVFENDPQNIENLGKAYIDGMDSGFKRGIKANIPVGAKKKSSNYKDTQAGFHQK